MNFERVIRRVVGGLEAEGVHYALIGDFTMSLRGLQRSTMDLDFILMLIADYLSLFQLESKLAELKEWHGKVE